MAENKTASVPTPEPIPEISVTDARAQLGEMQAALDRFERTTGQSGAVPLATKQMLLDASDVVKRHPNLRLRWVNVNNREKAEMRQHNGYVRLPDSEGGRQVGNLALFACSQGTYEARVKQYDELHKSRLTQHNREVGAEAEAIERIMRDRYGVKVKILIEE